MRNFSNRCSMTFYDDLIISRCANECKILIWRIEDFDSSVEPPERAPTTHEFRPTRSAWGGGYQVLFQLEAPKTVPFYIRFGLFHAPYQRPILAIGNNESKIYFWDLQSLEEWDTNDGEESREKARNKSKAKAKARGSVKLGPREMSIASSTATGQSPAPAEVNVQFSNSKAMQKFRVDDPFRLLLAHAESIVPKVSFAARQVAWSNGGEWMVVVGDQGMIAVFSR
jgi:polycomb protein EED